MLDPIQAEGQRPSVARSLLIEMFGWYAAFAIVAAYALTSFSILKPTDIACQLLNVSGGFGVALISFHKRAYQPGTVNIAWAIIAFAAILKTHFGG